MDQSGSENFFHAEVFSFEVFLRNYMMKQCQITKTKKGQDPLVSISDTLAVGHCILRSCSSAWNATVCLKSRFFSVIPTKSRKEMSFIFKINSAKISGGKAGVVLYNTLYCIISCVWCE